MHLDGGMFVVLILNIAHALVVLQLSAWYWVLLDGLVQLRVTLCAAVEAAADILWVFLCADANLAGGFFRVVLVCCYGITPRFSLLKIS